MEDVRKRYAEYRRLRQEPENTREDSQGEGRTETHATESATFNSDAPPAPRQQDIPSNSRDNLAPNAAHPPSPSPSSSPSPTTPMYITLLKLLLWALLWGFFIELGFGAVFFVTSLLYLIIVSLRGSHRKPWEPSAYSVFNRNFESIDGTLSAEQFERELRYGPMSVKK